MRSSIIFVCSLFILTACAEPAKVEKPRSQMTQRERDSTIAISRLPGAAVVKKGMSMADVGARRAAMLDSASSGN